MFKIINSGFQTEHMFIHVSPVCVGFLFGWENACVSEPREGKQTFHEYLRVHGGEEKYLSM